MCLHLLQEVWRLDIMPAKKECYWMAQHFWFTLDFGEWMRKDDNNKSNFSQFVSQGLIMFYEEFKVRGVWC